MEPRKTLRTVVRNILFLFFMFISEVSGSDWSYKGDVGPHSWHKHFSTCSGTKQSPINIIARDTLYDPTLTEFAIWFNPPHPEDHMIVLNNGHTVKVKTVGKFYIANGGLRNVYKTAQLHFHWGLEDDKGSEHQIDSASYPMELHIVNYDHSNYNSLQEAMVQPLGLAVLGVMFKVTKEDNPNLKPIIDVFGEIQKPGHPKVKINAQSIRNFLPKDTTKFYRYNGSLTTPGCYETVIWTIFKQENYISHEQMRKLRELFYNKETGGHPHHQHHHHDHEKLIEKEKQETILKEDVVKNPKIFSALSSEDNEKPEIIEEEDTIQEELPKLPVEINENNKKGTTKSDLLEQNHKTTKSELPAEPIKEESKQDETVISKDEPVVAALSKEDVVVPNDKEEIAAAAEEEAAAAAVKVIESDPIPKETTKATTPKSQESIKVKEQEPQPITGKEPEPKLEPEPEPKLEPEPEQEVLSEMQRDASYVQFKIPEHDSVIRKRQHGKHKKHHKKHHHHHHQHKQPNHHHVSKRDVDEDVASSEPMSDNSKEETNYLVEGDKKLLLIEEEIHKSDELFKEIKQEIKSHRIKKINIIDNYRPVQPLNDRIVLRSFPSFEDVSMSSYDIPKQQQQPPNDVHSKTEMVRSSPTKVCLALFINLIVILLTLA